MSKNINASQIRAARALLNWSQEELAETAGLSVATIRKIELGHISPRGNTMMSIVSCLELSKVEFMSAGVRLRDNDIVVLEGEDPYLQLLDDIYSTTQFKAGEILFMYGDTRLSTEEEINKEFEICELGNRWRILVEEGNNNLRFPLDDYRWLPSKYFKRNIQVVYGSKVAMGYNMDKIRNLTTKIIVIDSVILAQSTRNLFEFMWDSCQKPTFTTATRVYI